MALLERVRRIRARRVLVVAGALLLAGCFLQQTLREERPAFPHHAHGSVQGLSCVVCHQPLMQGSRPGMPTLELCAVCHLRLDVDKPRERTAAAFFGPDGIGQAVPRARFGDEVVFSHEAHVGHAGDCESCHPGIEASATIAAVPELGMDDCVACHVLGAWSPAAADAAPYAPAGPGLRECGACHREWSTTTRPESHGLAWTLQHGDAWRNPGDALTDRCDLCHSETSCVQCHRSQMPASHTNTWRLRTHGLEAAFDREACQVCHQDDSCSRCHAVTEPLSHTGAWGNPQDTHCLACHFPLGNESCAVCHQATPSHGDATPMPPWHDPAFNCRQCHGNGEELPHVDNGSSCTACHR